MAEHLNKSRILQTKILSISALFVAFVIDADMPLGDFFRYIGYVLVSFCAMGRLYTTMFIGGRKNQSLVTDGPYSIIRHPLYFLSLTGIVGISFITKNALVIAVFPICFIILYYQLMKREEAYLSEKFADTYLDYMQKTPRFLPNFARYEAPEIIMARPDFVRKAFRDSLVWFIALPLFDTLNLVKAGI